MGEQAMVVQEFVAPDFLKLFQERPDLVECVTLERPLHTAKIAGRDRALCRAVCMDLLLGRSKTEICAEYRVGWETVGAIEAVMKERGELRGLAQAISTNLASCIVLMGFRLREALLDGSFSAAQIPIAMGVLIDKKAQLDAGVVPGTGRTDAENAVERVRALWELELDRRRSADAASVVNTQVSSTIDVSATVDTARDTVQPSPASAPALPSWPDGAQPAPSSDQSADGGGGGLPAPASQNDRWADPEKF